MSVLKLSGLMCSVTIWTLWFDNMLLIIPESRYEVVLDYVVFTGAGDLPPYSLSHFYLVNANPRADLGVFGWR
jgi:hypothetical protein